MDIKINADYLYEENQLIESITEYNSIDDILFDGTRNQIKLVELESFSVAIKSFKIPNAFNKIIYKYLRKPKAQRSYEHAKFLLQNNIGTAEPIAYSLTSGPTGLQESYYISKFLAVNIILRDLLVKESYPERTMVLQQFTRFTHKLHELGIEFLDHSPGNTLINRISPGVYEFYLIDLNRMRFHRKLAFDRRLKNFRKLTQNESVLKIISAEYAVLSNQPEDMVYKKIVYYSRKFNRKSTIKRKIKAILSLANKQ